MHRIKKSGGLAWVYVNVPFGPQWVAKITKESTQLLDLKPGVQVMVLCKATAVSILAELPQPTPANWATGTVVRQSRQDPAEISLQISPHLNLIGFADKHAFKTGDKAYAFFEDSSLVLALV